MFRIIAPLGSQGLLSQPRDETKAAPLLGHVSARGHGVEVGDQVGHVVADLLGDDVTGLVRDIRELRFRLVVTLFLFLVTQVMS